MRVLQFPMGCTTNFVKPLAPLPGAPAAQQRATLALKVGSLEAEPSREQLAAIEEAVRAACAAALPVRTFAVEGGAAGCEARFGQALFDLNTVRPRLPARVGCGSAPGTGA